MRRSLLSTCTILGLAVALCAEDLGGGATASHGRVPRLILDRWIPGMTSTLRFVDLPAGVSKLFVGISTGTTKMQFVGFDGTLIANLFLPTSIVVVVNPSNPVIPLGTLPTNLNGTNVIIQGLVADTTGVHFTDATRIDFFKPLVMVGNQRQSANSISVIDLGRRQSVQRLTNSENGAIVFSPDRRWAYVTEPGSGRNRVQAYNLTTNPITVGRQIPVSGQIQSQASITRDGKRLYIPVNGKLNNLPAEGVSVIDTDPASLWFHTEIQKIKVPPPSKSNAGAPGTGPMAVAVTPDGKKLYIAYAELISFPGKATVGMIDLTSPKFPLKTIPITTGGVLSLGGGLGLAQRNDIVVSPDGQWVYTVEMGFDILFAGFQNGAVINAISTGADVELAAIPTNGFDITELAVDRMGRNLYVAQLKWGGGLQGGGIGQVLRIDVDRRSQNRFKVVNTIQVDPTRYAFNAGPKGIDVTPDGATVCVSVSEDTNHAGPAMLTIDTLTNKVFGKPIAVESLAFTLSVQQF